MPRQPRAVWAVAFACVIAFRDIGLVDPILKPIADQPGATPSQVSLLFTSYLAAMGVAMLATGAVASRIGAKRRLLAGLVIIIIGAGCAGLQDSISGIVAFRAVWGLGNALFIATALARSSRRRPGRSSRRSSRFGGALAPWLAGRLGEECGVHVPFWVGALAVFAAVGLLAAGRRFLPADNEQTRTVSTDSEEYAEALTSGDA